MSPVFQHGQLRLYLLTLLADGPRHGYEVIRDLEERFGGLYSPSAGTIYPRLARLEEEGLVVREDEGRKAVYSITDAGRAEVEARSADVAALESDLSRTVQQMADEVRNRVRGSARDLRAELAAAARDARKHARDAGPGLGGESPTYAGPDLKGAARQAEVLVGRFRDQARAALRRHGVTDATVAEVRTALDEALRRIENALQDKEKR